jgi:hypothetical protein
MSESEGKKSVDKVAIIGGGLVRLLKIRKLFNKFMLRKNNVSFDLFVKLKMQFFQSFLSQTDKLFSRQHLQHFPLVSNLIKLLIGTLFVFIENV